MKFKIFCFALGHIFLIKCSSIKPDSLMLSKKTSLKLLVKTTLALSFPTFSKSQEDCGYFGEFNTLQGFPFVNFVPNGLNIVSISSLINLCFTCNDDESKILLNRFGVDDPCNSDFVFNASDCSDENVICNCSPNVCDYLLVDPIQCDGLNVSNIVVNQCIFVTNVQPAGDIYSKYTCTEEGYDSSLYFNDPSCTIPDFTESFSLLDFPNCRRLECIESIDSTTTRQFTTTQKERIFSTSKPKPQESLGMFFDKILLINGFILCFLIFFIY